MIARFVDLMTELITNKDRNEWCLPMERGVGALKKFLVEAEASNTSLKLDSSHFNRSRAAAASSLFSPAETVRGSDGYSSSSPGTDSSPHSVLNMILWGEGDLSQTVS
jgi:hypothetical protein